MAPTPHAPGSLCPCMQLLAWSQRAVSRAQQRRNAGGRRGPKHRQHRADQHRVVAAPELGRLPCLADDLFQGVIRVAARLHAARIFQLDCGGGPRRPTLAPSGLVVTQKVLGLRVHLLKPVGIKPALHRPAVVLFELLQVLPQLAGALVHRQPHPRGGHQHEPPVRARHAHKAQHRQLREQQGGVHWRGHIVSGGRDAHDRPAAARRRPLGRRPKHALARQRAHRSAQEGRQPRR
mmetsp:Transcript_3386/g.8376  ORF Transcript_3386/g.8376 Transcript_3386/m.8376 type:complete len:235 (+) Transcript_3386:44-748(+)